MARGAFWLVVARFSMRFLGLLSTLVLTRLLTPADFGLIAMAMFVIGLLESLSAFGIAPALIQRKEITDDYYQTAWALQILRGILLASLLVLFAEPVASFYQEPALINVFKVLALITLINGFSCIYIVNLQRHLQFEREFHFKLKVKLISFFCTIIAAWLLRSYWALIIGTGVSAIMTVVFSYLYFPVRPRFSFSKVSEIFQFSGLVFLHETLSYLYWKIEILLLGRLAGSASTGLYELAKDISTTPISELTLPIARALFPGLSRLQHSPEQFSQIFLLTLAFVMAFGLPASIGLSLIADPLVTLFFSAEWQNMTPLIQIFAIYSVFRMFFGPTVSVFMAKGKIHVLVALSAITLPVKLISVAAFWYYGGLVGASVAVLIVSTIQMGFVFYYLNKLGLFWFEQFFYYSWRFIASTMAMGILLHLILLHYKVSMLSPLFAVSACVVAGASSYILCLAILWLISGRPDGIESLIVKELLRRLASRLRKQETFNVSSG